MKHNKIHAALVVIIMAAVAQAALAEPAMGEWGVRKFTDVMDDSVRVISDLWDDEDNTRLYVRCWHNDMDVYIVWGDDGYFGELSAIEAQTRVDGDEVVSEDWSVSTNGSSLFAPHVNELLSRLIDASRLIVRITPPNKSPVTVSFDLDGVRWAIMPVADMCGRLWRFSGDMPVNESSVFWAVTVLRHFSEGKGAMLPDYVEKWRPLIAKSFEELLQEYQAVEEAD